MSQPDLLDVSHLGGWAAQWDALVDSSPLPSPFLRSWWLGTGGARRHFLLVVDETRLLGGLALEKAHALSRIHMMGDGHLCPDHLDLLAASGHEEVVTRVLRDWLCRSGPRLFNLRGVRAGSRLIQALPGPVRCDPVGAAPYALLPDCPDAFRAGLSSHLRRKISTTTKRLAAEGVTHQIVRGPALLSRLSMLRRLHRSRWGNRSDFLPAFDRFTAGCAGGCAADEVVIHELRNHDLVVAMVLTFEVARRVSVYQSARLTDRRWRDSGTLLFAAAIEDACARGFTEVDFLRGEESWKARFSSGHRPIVRLVAGKGVTGRVGCALDAASAFGAQTAVRGVRLGREAMARWRS